LKNKPPPVDFVAWLRQAAPYVHAFRDKTFVIAFGGEVLAEDKFTALAHDLNLLLSLDVRLVLVHGVRPQVEARLAELGMETQYVRGRRVTDAHALECVKEAVGVARVDIEAALSQGLPNSPMAGSDIRVASGNFVTAQPVGVIDGVDLLHAGEVRKVNAAAINTRLEDGEIVLLSPLGYSPTGEVFNLTLEDVAAAAAAALRAEKLVFLSDAPGVIVSDKLRRELDVAEARRVLAGRARLEEDVRVYLPHCIAACENGVARAHLIDRDRDGALLLELFTRDGVGTMVSPAPLETLRPATIADVGGLLALLEPLEAEGILVKRSREKLEREIDRFVVLEHDRTIVGSAALYPFPDEGAGELACLAVHPDFRDGGRGERLLDEIAARARKQKLARLFVLTTRTAHWFVERGFKEGDARRLPRARAALYNWQRRSKVFEKTL
jgi:amino-acid N-acetyltransferase